VDAVAQVAAPAYAGDRPFSTWLRAWGLHAEVMLAFATGAAVAFTLDRAPYVSLVVLFVWMFGNFKYGRAVTTPVARQLQSVARSTLLPLTAVAAGVGFLGLQTTAIPNAFATVAAGACVSVACRALRWRLQAPVRAIVVGDRGAVATATTRWARGPGVHVVGGLLVEQDLDVDDAPKDILGVPTKFGLDSVKAFVESQRADLVVVHNGAGITAESFRELTWELDESRCSVGVSGLLESVAPHRITPGGLGRSAIMDVRPPRPSTVVRGVKSAFDRLSAALLLLVIAPFLLLVGLAVRLDSKGPAFFTQIRVGRHGRTFRVYKFRTMVDGADAMKQDLSDSNEFDSVLFKIHHDPRVTRVGRILRKTSLDELPQLINVLRGEMSLVGPRPCLQSEMVHMEPSALRRHAVKPGITGLWQVSGRSDLAWDESTALDTYYADNWNLATDAAICMRTVKAVTSGKGAY
jgi:exopolysaccharide biosynthesis polyprenyl glycosylphosphotransferase